MTVVTYDVVTPSQRPLGRTCANLCAVETCALVWRLCSCRSPIIFSLSLCTLPFAVLHDRSLHSLFSTFSLLRRCFNTRFCTICVYMYQCRQCSFFVTSLAHQSIYLRVELIQSSLLPFGTIKRDLLRQVAFKSSHTFSMPRSGKRGSQEEGCLFRDCRKKFGETQWKEQSSFGRVGLFEKSHFRLQMAHWSESWSLKCELLFVLGGGRGFKWN